jgi:hypothetical protein
MAFHGGDIFIGDDAAVAAAGRQVPKIWHFDSSGTFIETLVIPETVDDNFNPYSTHGAAVGSDGRLYIYVTYDLNSGGFHTHYRLAKFEADGSWGGYINDVYLDEINNGNLAPSREGDLFLVRSRQGVGDPSTDVARVLTSDGSDVWASTSIFHTTLSATGKVTVAPVGGSGEERIFLPGIVDPAGANYIGAEILKGSDGSHLDTVDLSVTDSSGELCGSLDKTVHLSVDITTGDYVYTTHVFDKTFTEINSFEFFTLPSTGGFDGGGQVFIDLALSPMGTDLWVITYEFTEDPDTFESTYSSYLYHQELTTGTWSLVYTFPTPTLAEMIAISPYFECGATPAAYSGLTMWVEGTSIIGLSDGDPVTPNWSEAGPITIGNNGDLVPTTGGVRAPATWVASDVCSQPGVKFTGTGDPATLINEMATTTRRLYDSGDASISLLSGTGFTMFWLARIASDVSPEFPGNFGFAWDDLGNNGITFEGRTATETPAVPIIFIGFATDSIGGFVSISSPYTIGDWVLVEVWWDGSTLHAQYNGLGEQTVAMPSFYADPTIATYFREAHENGSEGVAEMVGATSFNRCLTDAERVAIRTGYFQCRYPCLDFGPGPTPPSNIRLRATQFTRIGMGAGI